MKEEIIVNIPYHEEDKHLNIDGSVINLGNYKITIISRPTTQTKDFLWYIDRYLDVSGSSTSDEIVNWFEYQQADSLKHKLKTSQFSLVPWEIKMGLFKFICEDNGLDKDDIIMLVTVWNTKGRLYAQSCDYVGTKVTRICSHLMSDIFNTMA